MKELLRNTWGLFKRSVLFRIGVYCVIIFGVLSVIGGCAMWMPGKSYRGPLDPLTNAQETLRDALRRDLTTLVVGIGERNVYRMDAMNRAADWIEAEFKSGDYTVTRQSYQADNETFFNIEAELTGTDRADEIVVIGSHYDSVPGSPGANDNGTGVVAVLALARAFSQKRPSRTLRFVAFANEEPPYFQYPGMGSSVYAKACRERDDTIVAMLTPETIGYYSDDKHSQGYPFPFNLFYPSTGNFIAFVGNAKSGKLVRQCVGAFRERTRFPSEGAALPEFIPAAGLSDHWAFWQEGYPGLMITDTAFYRYQHYHTGEDTIDKIQFDHLARVVEGLETVVSKLADK